MSTKRQFISVKFEIDLPLKQEEVDDAIGLLESFLDVLRSASDRHRVQPVSSPCGTESKE